MYEIQQIIGLEIIETIIACIVLSSIISYIIILTIIRNYGETITLDVPTRKGYEFKGYKTSDNTILEKPNCLNNLIVSMLKTFMV
jgi:hypothetical protein